MELIVHILSFGTAWWVRPGEDQNDPLRFTGHAAYFNSTGIQQASKIHTAGPVHGLVRFNVSSGLDPHRTQANIGQNFACTEVEVYRNTNRLLAIRRAPDPLVPTHFLACMTSAIHGAISPRDSWRKDNAEIISMSRYRGRQETLLLIASRGHVRTPVGCWTVTQSGENRHQLALSNEL
jgi:hypothetical protein